MSRRKPRKDRAASTLPVHPKGRGGSRLVRRQGRRWAWLALPALLVLVVGAFALMRVGLIGSNPAAAKLPAPLREAAAKLPAPLREAPALVQEGYLYALERPDVLQYLPCFCGCWAPDHGGHTSNLSCFVKDGSLAAGRLEFEPHGSAWDMCVYIARDAKRLVQEGKSLREIRAYIDYRYGGAGNGTPTPLPPA